MGDPVKSFVIDTNVFIHRPDAINSFRDNEVVVPLWVLEELDKLKGFSDERGRNARRSVRMLDELSRHGNLSEGVKMENGSILRVEQTHAKNTHDLLTDKIDNKIILTAVKLQQEGKLVFFVSKDINARVKAQSLGIKAVDYEKQKVNYDSLYSGFIEAESSESAIRDFEADGDMSWGSELVANEFVILKDAGRKALGRYDADLRNLRYVTPIENPVCGVRPLNIQQRMAFDLLLDPDIPLVSLVGIAGTGKTLLAIAAGLQETLEEKRYTRVLVSRPVIPMGKDIGYLPGAKDEKLGHWMQPLFDNLEYIVNQYKKQHLKSVDNLVSSKIIELEALAYIRGRSLPNQYIIIDEAQNLSPHEVKTIVSRAGEGSKVVLTGDPEQIDNPYLDANSNGLTYLVEAFKGQTVFGHVSLKKSERSKLAELAAELL